MLRLLRVGTGSKGGGTLLFDLLLLLALTQVSILSGKIPPSVEIIKKHSLALYTADQLIQALTLQTSCNRTLNLRLLEFNAQLGNNVGVSELEFVRKTVQLFVKGFLDFRRSVNKSASSPGRKLTDQRQS